jgi:acetyl esterase/lipase
MADAISICEPVFLWEAHPEWRTEQGRPSITPYLLPRRADGTPRPAILVIPGGGYGCVCTSTEGGPIARGFNELGYNCFVLDYRCGKFGQYPDIFADAKRAVKLIRARADQFGIAADQVYSCGFSAGGHLAGALGTDFCDDIDVSCGDAADAQSGRVNAMLLGYPVTTGDKAVGHDGTLKNCWGIPFDGTEPTLKQVRYFALCNHIDEQTAPAFIWHTMADQIVPVEGSFEFAAALKKAGIICSLHIFPFGDHGMLRAIGTDAGVWQAMADAFLQKLVERKHLSADEFHAQYTNDEQGRRVGAWA